MARVARDLGRPGGEDRLPDPVLVRDLREPLRDRVQVAAASERRMDQPADLVIRDPLGLLFQFLEVAPVLLVLALQRGEGVPRLVAFRARTRAVVSDLLQVELLLVDPVLLAKLPVLLD